MGKSRTSVCVCVCVCAVLNDVFVSVSRGFIVHSGDHQAVFKPSSVQSMW